MFSGSAGVRGKALPEAEGRCAAFFLSADQKYNLPSGAKPDGLKTRARSSGFCIEPQCAGVCFMNLTIPGGTAVFLNALPPASVDFAAFFLSADQKRI